MSKSVRIQLLRIVDVDPFSNGMPYVKVTGSSGEIYTSAQGMAEKDASKYSFDPSDKRNCALIAFSASPIRCMVEVFSTDGAGNITQYPGVGKISIFADEMKLDEQTCPLYEDGDDMLEIGALIFKSEIVGDSHDHVELNAEDWNADSLQLSPREDDFNTQSLQLTPRPEENNASAPAAAPVDDVPDPFDRSAKLTETDMAKYLGEGEGENSAIFDVDSVGPEEELIVAPVLHVHPEHLHAAQAAAHTVQSVPPLALQDWQAVGQGPDPALIAETIRADLDRVEPRCSKVVVRLQSLICSSHRVLDAAGASVKLSLLPLPGRVVTLRSVPNKGDAPADGQGGDGSSAQTVSTSYSFGMKTAQLSMGVGDLRSKTFREGACPRLCVEVSLSGAESYSAFAELYLPTVLTDLAGQVISIPLVAPCRNDGDHTSAAITGTLLLEVNPPDLVPAGAEMEGSPPLRESPVKKSKSPSKKGRTVGDQQQAATAPAVPSKADFVVHLQGMCGPELQEHEGFASTTIVEAYLTTSGCTETASLSRCATKAAGPSALSIKKDFFLFSLRPKADLLQLRFRNGPFPEDEFGRVCVPLAAFFQPGSSDAVVNKTIALTARKVSAERGGTYQPCQWKAVLSVSYRAVDSAASQKSTAALTLESSAAFTPAGTGHPDAALSATNSPARAGNWMSSPERMAGTYGGNHGAGSPVKPTAVKSVAGQLLCCAKGYFSARWGVDATGNQEFAAGEGSSSLVSKGCALSVEATLLPEGLRKKTDPCAVTLVQGGDIDATAAWAQPISMFVAYALQQRPVPMLRLTLYSERNTPSQSKTGLSKVPVATTTVDLTTLMMSADCPPITCLLPLNRAGAVSLQTTLVDSREDLAGWLLLGLQFRPSSLNPGLDVKAELESLKLSMQMQWDSLSAYPTQYLLGLSRKGDLTAASTIKALQVQPDKLRTSDLHVALSALQFASQRTVAELMVDDVFDPSEDGWVTCVVKAMNDPDCTAHVLGVLQNDHVVWNKSDAVLKILRESSLSLLLYVYLYRGNHSAGLPDAANAIAEANLAVSRSQLDKGVPINLLLPLRDKKGEKAATLSLSVQLTTMGSADGAASPSATQLTSTVRSSSEGAQPVPLRVEFCEGNIADSDVDDKMEPFFECSLLLPEGEELQASPGYATRARTGFLRMSDKLEYWGLDCVVHVPPVSAASIGNSTTAMLAASRTRSTFDAAQLSNGACIMGVVCRDASKQGCPEIGWARLALPRQLVLLGKSVEQWITLSPPQARAAPSQSVPAVATSKHSRMKLRITVDHRDYDAAYSPFGIGAVLMRALGVHDFRAGMNDDLVAARVSACPWPPGSVLGDTTADGKEVLVFSQMSAHPATYVNEMSIFNQDNLVGSLPVSGGFGDVRMSVKTFTTNTAYTASFPIMAATTKCVEGAELPPIPVLNLNLSRDRPAGLSDPARPQKARLEPQLKLAAVYVPYVTGRLVLHCTKVELVVPPAEDVPRAAVLRSPDNPLAVRYLLGNNSARFTFSAPFVPDGGSPGKPLSGPPSLSESPNVTLMEVDTFDVISTAIRRGENMTMLPLFVSLLEQWDLLDPAVERRGQQACVGVGYIPTAVCYYQALRAAASSPMEAAESASGAASGTTGAAKAASPWLSAVVDLFDPKTKLKVAVMHLNVQFLMTGVPDHVLRLLGSTVSKSLSDPAAKARTELGLKQSFLLADTDKSGAVSSEELLQIIMKFGKQAASSRRALKTGTSTIGMENAVGLLLQLANVPEDDLGTVDPSAVGDMVRRIFSQLDVDGDGLVSWWEWKSVLTAAILGHNRTSTHMYHLDALVIGMQAAHDAIRSLSLNQSLQGMVSNYQGAAGDATTRSTLPYIRMKVQGYDPSSLEAIVVPDDDEVSVGSAPSKTVTRLHSMVKSLRLTNSVLAKRFEKALSVAQNLAIDLDQDAVGGATTSDQQRGGAKLSEIESLEQRIRDTEHQSEENLHSFLTAKERADRLAAELAKLQTLASVAPTQTKPETRLFNEELEREIRANEEKLRNAQLLRKQRTSEMLSLFRLKALVSKLIMPKVHRRRKEKAAAELARVLRNQVVRRNYAAEKEKRAKAALVLQGAGRGLLGRKKVKEMQAVATKTQSLFRAKMARRQVQNLRVEKEERDRLERERQWQLKRNMAALRITRNLRVYVERIKAEKNSAALRLQAALKQRLNFKVAKKEAAERRKQQDLRSAEEKRLAEELAALQEAERRRAEEERRRQEAALKLTRVLSNQSNIKVGKKIHAFLAAQNQLTLVPRPSLEEVTGKWVSYPKTMTTQPSDAEEAQSTFKYFGRGNYGNIQTVDPRSRIMDVLFLYNKVEGNVKKSGAQFEVVKLPYDHPLLEYYTHEVPAAPELGYLVSYSSGAEHQWLPFRPFNERPSRIEDTPGYRVGLKDPELDPTGKEGAIYPGRIIGFDRLRETVTILFDASDPNSEPDMEDVPWKSPDLQWLMPGSVSRPKTIQEAVGYNVEVNRVLKSGEVLHRATRVTVIGINAAENTVRVVYAPPPGHTYATEAEYVPFESDNIAWLNKVPLDQLPSSPRPAGGPIISKMVEVPRPLNIMDTVGHLVEVRAVGEDAEPGDLYSGMVVAADSNAGTVRILYDRAEKGASTPLPTKTSPRRRSLRDGSSAQSSVGREQLTSVQSEEEGEDTEEDFEDLPWTSPDIVWVAQDPSTMRPPSAARRPKALADALGKHIDVLCREPDAVEGDYFSGVVVSVDNEKQTLRVKFDGDGNGEDDVEDLPWNSPDIFWLSDESINARDNRPPPAAEEEEAGPALGSGSQSARSLGNSSLASHLTVRPKSIAEAGEWKIKVGADLRDGEVAAVEAETHCVWAVFGSVPDAPAPVQVKIHWQSPNLEWLTMPATPAASPKKQQTPKEGEDDAAVEGEAAAAASAEEAPPKRPRTLAAAVGWAVEVRAEDAEDEVFVGQVGAVDEVHNTVTVLFAGEDGSLQQDDSEHFPFDSALINWVSPPAAPAGSDAKKSESDAASPAAKKTAAPAQPEETITAAPAGKCPKTIEEAVGRKVGVVVDFAPGTVVSISQALQTVNVQLETQEWSGIPANAATLLVGLPFASSMIEWDCKL